MTRSNLRASLLLASLALVLGLVCSTGAARAQMLAPPPAPTEAGPHALGLRARWLTVPGWAIAPYVDAHTELNAGWSVGLEYLYRRPAFDVVVSVDYSWLEARSGNYLGGGNDPATETHFIRFDRLSSISADVSLIGHWNLTPWMEIRFGGGLGIGGVLGNLYQINSNSGCTKENAGDSTVCYPKNVGPIQKVDEATVQKLESVGCTPDFANNGMDTPSHPCLRKVDTYPFNARVVPVLNVLLGLRFRAHKNVYIHVDGGFRLAAFYLGAGPEFRF